MEEHRDRLRVDEAQAVRRERRAGARGGRAAEGVELGDATLAARHLEERVGKVELALERAPGEQFEADRLVGTQVDDRLDHAGQPLQRDDLLELVAESRADLVAFHFDGAGGALDGVEQRALEPHLRRLGEPGAADEQVDLRQEPGLELVLEPLQQLPLEALLDHHQIVFGDEPAPAPRREDDEEGVAEARDGDVVVAADESPSRLLQSVSDGAVHVVHDLEALQLLQGVHASEAHVDDAELTVIVEHPLHVELYVGERRQPGDVVVVHAGVAQDVGDRAQQVVGAEGLRDVRRGAGPAGLHHVGQVRLRGEEHHGDVLGVAELELPADLVAVHAGHGDVEEDEVRVPGEGELESLLAVVRRGHVVAVGDENSGDGRRQVGVVIDDENVGLLTRHASPPIGSPRTDSHDCACPRTDWYRQSARKD